MRPKVLIFAGSIRKESLHRKLALVAADALRAAGLDVTWADLRDYPMPFYDGDLHARDAAYHQGTVWSWLIGPFVDAWMKVHDDRAGALRFLEGFPPHLSNACIGTISEVFDAEDPYTPRGCVAQAWGVAEVLRVRLRVASRELRGLPAEVS